MINRINQMMGQTASMPRERKTLPISVVIVSYNSRELLRACLTSIESEQCNQVLVTDNASSDGSVEMVRQEFPGVALAANKKNHGYGTAANIAIIACSSKYVLLLNCDTLLHPGTLQALSDYLDQHPKVAIVGPALLNPDGTAQASCFHFPTPWQTLVRETSLSALIRRFTGSHSDDLLTGLPRSARAVPWVLGAAFAIRREAFESVGGFDPSFFMYYEEVDLCYRLQKAGWQIHFSPAGSITHVGGASTRQYRAAMTQELYKSLCHFYRRHYSSRQKFQLRLVLTYVMLRNIGRDVVGQGLLNKGPANDDVPIWRSILSNVWSRHGWLTH